jgi:hypothetical protein
MRQSVGFADRMGRLQPDCMPNADMFQSIVVLLRGFRAKSTD